VGFVIESPSELKINFIKWRGCRVENRIFEIELYHAMAIFFNINFLIINM
jgi:hypothetical protein